MHTPYDDDNGEINDRPSAVRTIVRIVALTVTAGVIVGAGAAMLTAGLERARDATLAPGVPEPSTVAVAEVVTPENPGQALLDAQATVAELEAHLAEKEQALVAIATAAGLSPDEFEDQALVTEVATLRANLVAARQYRDQLKVQLKEALAAVELQSDETLRARAQAAAWQATSVRTRWEALAATAAAEVCDHGSRKSVDKCQEGVESYFTEARFERFADCVESANATPALYAVPRGDAVPSTAEGIGQRPLFARQDWYVVYCDPTLPERADDQMASVE